MILSNKQIGWGAILTALLFNIWTLTYLFSSDNHIESFFIKLIIWLCQFTLILTGSYLNNFIDIKRLTQILTGCIFICFTLLSLLTLSELVLFFNPVLRAKWDEPKSNNKSNRFEEFRKQHIHPIYLFYYPFDITERRKINNEYVSITDDGFRGWGPDKKGDKKLAFITGGSVAFGGSTDTTTIAGYLNKLQDQYLFINAGVISWISTQELSRIMYQISEYQPELVISFSGFNDASIFEEYKKRNDRLYPPGIPESFGFLYDLIDDIRSTPRKHEKPIIQSIFPRTYGWLTDNKNDRPIHGVNNTQQMSDKDYFLWAKKYAHNINLMKPMVESWGGRFIGIFQPVASTHSNWNEISQSFDRDLYWWESAVAGKIPLFIKEVYNNLGKNVEFYNFSNILDFTNKRPNINNHQPKFHDICHFNDPFYHIVAKEILSIVENLNYENK
jgi:hypothetical protein